jgi:hypothetical protein
MDELRQLGFISGPDSHPMLADPAPIIDKLKRDKARVEEEYDKMIACKSAVTEGEQTGGDLGVQRAKRDYLQEATDAWNKYRPKDYAKIRRISMQLVRAIDIHMKDLGIKAHDYEEFFSVIKAGVESSDFWSNQNRSRTLNSITGVGTPSDTKRSNVYNLFNAGVDSPAEPTKEEDRSDTIVYDPSVRKLISDYEDAQHSYQQAWSQGTITRDVELFVIRTETNLVEAGLDPARFRFKYGLDRWPTGTPEPEESRVINWTFADEVGYAG